MRLIIIFFSAFLAGCSTTPRAPLDNSYLEKDLKGMMLHHFSFNQVNIHDLFAHLEDETNKQIKDGKRFTFEVVGLPEPEKATNNTHEDQPTSTSTGIRHVTMYDMIRYVVSVSNTSYDYDNQKRLLTIKPNDEASF